MAAARARPVATLAAVDGFGHTDAQRLRPRWARECFALHESAGALFRWEPETGALAA